MQSSCISVFLGFFSAFIVMEKTQPEQIPVLINDPAMELIGNLKAISLHFPFHFANIFYILLGMPSKTGKHSAEGEPCTQQVSYISWK